MRITKQQIRARITELQERGVDIVIDSAYGQYRFENSKGECLSLRLPPGQLSTWLDGYETALRSKVSLALAVPSVTDRLTRIQNSLAAMKRADEEEKEGEREEATRC